MSVLRIMKYVLVTGGVVSGLGKGVTASSIGVVLKACGLRVTSIKIGTLAILPVKDLFLPSSRGVFGVLHNLGVVNFESFGRCSDVHVTWSNG